jgi:hypothetical protein
VENAFATATLIEWFNKNRASFSKHINSQDFGTPSGRAAGLQLNLPSHTVAITAWDQGNRLEIITIDLATEEAKVEDNSYSSSDKLLARLDAFIDQFFLISE